MPAILRSSNTAARILPLTVPSQTGAGAPNSLLYSPRQEPTSLQFVVTRQSATQAGGQATVRLVVIGSRGEWFTFVVGGHRAF